MAIQVTRLLHTRMRVADMQASVDFYTRVLGLSVLSRHSSPRGSELVFLGVPGSPEEIELCAFPASGPVRVPEDLVHLAFQVDDLGATIQRLEQMGVAVTDGPHDSRSGRFCFIDAPEGYEIELIEQRQE
ncbi:MAG: VOC family protein [Nitrospirota bacterium]|nr:VOC family protein [Nitrospirota bacterium]